MAAERGIKHCAQAVDVGGGPDLAEVGIQAGLFGCHVFWGASQHPLPGESGVCFIGPGQSEIGELGCQPARLLAGRCQQNIIRLHVAMDDAHGVRFGHGPGEVTHHGGRQPGGQRPVVDHLLQAAPWQPFHDQVEVAVHFAPAVDLHHMGVCQPGQGLGFPFGPLSRGW